MKHTHTLTIITAALCASTITSQGSISFVNSIIDTRATTRSGSVNSTPALTSEVIQWSDTSFAKTLDIDGDNRYGTAGYFFANTTAQNANANTAVSQERVPSFTSAAVANGTNNIDGNFQNANGTTGFIQNDANNATLRLGYVGFNGGTGGVAIPLTDLFSYTLTADQAIGETLRLGVIGGTNNGDSRLGFTDLTITAGGLSASTTDNRGANTGNAPDLYFFDITGLVTGDTIVISAANSNTVGSNFNAATIGGITFDTIVVPEPSSTALLGLGGLALILRRRK
ncbi:MAG: PEP-CTERM sorting domain-containing protein [Akkermansiaceae bacterium]